MDQVVRGLDFCYVYIDDLLVASSSPLEHQQHLRLIFETTFSSRDYHQRAEVYLWSIQCPILRAPSGPWWNPPTPDESASHRWLPTTDFSPTTPHIFRSNQFLPSIHPWLCQNSRATQFSLGVIHRTSLMGDTATQAFSAIMLLQLQRYWYILHPMPWLA